MVSRRASRCCMGIPDPRPVGGFQSASKSSNHLRHQICKTTRFRECVSPGSRPRRPIRILGLALRGLRLPRRTALRSSSNIAPHTPIRQPEQPNNQATTSATPPIIRLSQTIKQPPAASVAGHGFHCPYFVVDSADAITWELEVAGHGFHCPYFVPAVGQCSHHGDLQKEALRFVCGVSVVVCGYCGVRVSRSVRLGLFVYSSIRVL